MKKILLVILTSLTIAMNAQTSVYHSFPDSAAVWNIHYQAYCFINGDGNDYYSITFSNDTSIGGQTYHKLITPFVQSFSTGTCGSGRIAGYQGSIREDSLNRKVFFVPPSQSAEQLLYDFNMQVGDTVKGYLESFAYPSDTVISVDSVLVGTNYRKRWNINSCYNISIVEGIGSTYGFYQATPGCITDAPGYAITCFEEHGQTLYPAFPTNCGLITNVSAIDDLSAQIRIFPNPSAGKTTLDFGKAHIKELQVTDVLGNVVYKRILHLQTSLEINDLKAGTYFITLTDTDNRRISRKIISGQ
jgi:hypothetical protein